MRDAIKTALKAGIEHPSEGYAGLGGTNLASIGWNIVMIQVGNYLGIAYMYEKQKKNCL